MSRNTNGLCCIRTSIILHKPVCYNCRVIIVTAGYQFADIDAYGGCIAYTELLQKLGQNARAVITAPLNDSITSTIRSWNAPLDTIYQPNDSDTFCVIDISESAFLEKFVDPKRVVKVIDHHVGFERDWAHLGADANIEFIGAACTLVFEEWVLAGKLEEMSEISAKLLIAGILDNTLNFNASITTERDHVAYRELLPIAGVDESWTAEYFADCQASIENDLRSAIKNDTKTILDTTRLPKTFAQLTLWNGEEFIARRKDDIVEILDATDPDWMLNIIAMEEGCSYLIADNPTIQAKVSELMGVEFEGDIAKTDRLYLRKEILKKAQE